MELFREQLPESGSSEIPLVVSVPHAGVAFPDEIRQQFRDDIMFHPPDTDWFVHKLYDFVPDLGGTLVCAQLSRYVVDLNRDPHGQALYDDGRVITSVVPDRTFSGAPLCYGERPSAAEMADRVDRYFTPYHRHLEERLQTMQQRFGYCLLFDAHSIKSLVPQIQKEPFPDFMVGTNDGRSSMAPLEQAAMEVLSDRGRLNHTFKGGYITRRFGQPEKHIHAVQLEMCQHLYMDETTDQFDSDKAGSIKGDLRRLLEGLMACLAKQYA